MNKDKLLEQLIEFEDLKGRFLYSPLLSSWNDHLSEESFIQNLQRSVVEHGHLDIYAHIPFCHDLCTFCGCNIKVTANTGQGNDYINALIKEWDGYAHLLPQKVVRSLTIGGGTPTFLPADTLDILLSKFSNAQWKQVEVDPRYINQQHLDLFKKHSINRINIGIQDFDETVLKIVNRSQKLEQIEKLFDWGKEQQNLEISADLIFGLPGQSLESALKTANKICHYSPDMINLYPLALVPWLIDTQKAYGNFEVPSKELKWKIYLQIRNVLLSHGYIHQGFGHFFKSTSATYKQILVQNASRQLMGVLPFSSGPYLGLGAGSVSSTLGILAQNEKVTEKYLHLNSKSLNTKVKMHNQTAVERELTQKYQSLFLNHHCNDQRFSDNGKLNELGIELIKVVAQELKTLL